MSEITKCSGSRWWVEYLPQTMRNSCQKCANNFCQFYKAAFSSWFRTTTFHVDAYCLNMDEWNRNMSIGNYTIILNAGQRLPIPSQYCVCTRRKKKAPRHPSFARLNVWLPSLNRLPRKIVGVKVTELFFFFLLDIFALPLQRRSSLQ
jgi:hypothetical protein